MRPFAIALMSAAPLFAQSGSVSNAADYQVTGIASFLANFESLSFSIPSGPPALAPRSLAIINSYSFSASASPSASVSLRPSGSSTTVAAQVIAVDSSSITFVVPPDAPAGPAQLIYRFQGDVTRWVEVSIVPASFALFRSGPPGPLRAQQIAADGSIVNNGLASPAKPGQVVVLWGSGLGATQQANVAVTLGGVPQTVLYAGASPSVPGVDQINFRIGPGTPIGCYVPLIVTYNSQNSVASFLSESADGSPCSHPLQLTAGELKMLDAGGTIAVEQITAQSSLQIVSADHAARTETVTSTSANGNAVLFASMFTAQRQQGCVIPATIPAALIGAIFDPGTITDGIDVISMGKTSIAIPSTLQSIDAALSNIPPPLLAANSWTWTSSGGAMSFPFTLPAPVRLGGSAPLVLARDRDQILTWNGSAYDSAGSMTINITGANNAPLLTCTAPANAGALTIAKDLLLKISPTAAMLTAQVSEPSSSTGFAQFTQKNGNALLVMANSSSSDTRPVDIE